MGAGLCGNGDCSCGDPCAGTGGAAAAEGTAAGGDTDTGRCCCAVGGELEAARGRGLLLRLRGPPEFEPGVTASNADPRPDGRLYGEKRWFFSAFSGDAGDAWPE